MDPNQILDQWELSIVMRKWGDAIEEMHAYYHWRLKGGVQPAGGDKRAEALSMKLADALDNLTH